MGNNKTIRVCHISTVHGVSDVRIFYKELLSLNEFGYETHFIIPNNKDEIIQGVHIHALPFYKNRFKRLIAGNWKSFFVALKTHSTVCHFHDPELMFCGVWLRLSGRKVIYDVHEDLPKQVLYKEWIKSKTVKAFFSFLIKYFEKFSCLFFQGIVAATDDIAIKFSKRKAITVKNYPIVELIEKAFVPKENNDNFTMVYAGGLTKVRGIVEMIDAVGLLNGKCRLILLGEFDRDDYKESCMRSSGWKFTNYFGKVNPEEVYSYIYKADVGFAMLYPIKNYLTSLPVKVFEYMACGKPVVMSDFDYWKEIFGDVALYCNPASPNEIAACINLLMENKNNATHMGQKGKALILEKFSWENEKEKLFKLYEKILARNKKST